MDPDSTLAVYELTKTGRVTLIPCFQAERKQTKMMKMGYQIHDPDPKSCSIQKQKFRHDPYSPERRW
ncbi:hypothetical protein CWM66_07855 [Kosakonia sp. H7A]|nr:hypothetical protein [Kosakonia sp. MH5]PTA93914.1 hypothetical protein CWM66_07855 [Kosakonia sp. H7A]